MEEGLLSHFLSPTDCCVSAGSSAGSGACFRMGCDGLLPLSAGGPQPLLGSPLHVEMADVSVFAH